MVAAALIPPLLYRFLGPLQFKTAARFYRVAAQILPRLIILEKPPEMMDGSVLAL
jgi:hypothetical protein